MNKNETQCLLCARALQMVSSWKTLLTKQFPPSSCEKCLAEFERSASKTSLYRYNDAMKDFLHQYKFLQDVALAKVFRQELHAIFKHEKATIIPIPMHIEKQKERTFAHMDELLKAAQIPYTQLLEKTTIERQSSKTKEERLQTAPLFKLLSDASVEYKEYLLFDDIKTTGTTLQHARTVLEEAGAKNIRIFTLISG